MVLASFMLGISSLVISALAFVNANMLDGKFNTMIDKFDIIETQYHCMNARLEIHKMQKAKPKKVVKKCVKKTKTGQKRTKKDKL